MVRYFYAWTPFVVVVGTVVLLSSYLALIALMLVALGALAAVAAAVVFVPYMLGRAIGRRRRDRATAVPQPAVTAPVDRGVEVRRGPLPVRTAAQPVAADLLSSRSYTSRWVV